MCIVYRGILLEPTFFNFALEMWRVSESFISLGKICNIFRAKNNVDLVPYLTDLVPYLISYLNYQYQTQLKCYHHILTNCLGYRYRYGPKFYNWLPVFLEKAQTTGTNQNFIIRCRYFSYCYLFVSS